MRSYFFIIGPGCLYKISVTVIALLLFSGCVTAPLQEMTDARLAVKAAQEVRAAQYTPTALAAAEDTLAQAERNLAAGELEPARAQALAAKAYAIKAYDIAVALEQVRTVWQLIATVGQRAQVTSPLLEQAEIAAQKGDSEAALRLAEVAYEEATTALNRVYLKQTCDWLMEIKAQSIPLAADESELFVAAETAYRHDEGKKAYDLVNLLVGKISARSPLFLP